MDENEQISIENETPIQEDKKKQPSSKGFIIEMLIYVVLILVCLFVVPKYVLQRTVVDGESMENTLHQGESLLVEKVSKHFTDPKRFDVVVFYPLGEDVDEYYVKRVIGLPGENVRIEDNKIYINGTLLNESYGKNEMDTGGIAECEEGITLSDDEFFVLGDNRAVSYDSRYEGVGPVSRDKLSGRVLLRIWPLSKFGTID